MRVQKLVTFGFKQRVPPSGVLVVDVRDVGLRNPHGDRALRPLDGRDQRVKEYVQFSPNYDTIYVSILRKILHEGEGTVMIGCVGGRHRSVVIAEQLAAEMLVPVEHLELQG